MRKHLWLALAVLLVFPALAKAVNEDSLWMYEHYTKKEVYIPMRDGSAYLLPCICRRIMRKSIRY